ncbi:MAG: carboxymuconolactone decarboxylase family protein [Rhodoferax sp.]|nr:carboxymuconolactone decarboxylase family protein [Rhodoferax sp.]
MWKQREGIALAAGQINQCQYCLSAHTMLGKRVRPWQVLEARFIIGQAYR